MEAKRGGNRSRRNVVGSAEGREEIVKRFLISQVDNRHASAPFVFVAVKNVVVADGGVEIHAARP